MLSRESFDVSYETSFRFFFEPAFDVLKQSWRRTRRTSASARRFLRPRQSILCPARTSADGFGLEQRGAVGDGRTSGRATAWWLRGVYIQEGGLRAPGHRRADVCTVPLLLAGNAKCWGPSPLWFLSGWVVGTYIINRPTNDHSAAYLDSPLGTRCAGGCQA